MSAEKHLNFNGKDYYLYIFNNSGDCVWAWEVEMPNKEWATEELGFDCIEDVAEYFYYEIRDYLDGYSEKELQEMEENKDDCNYLTVMSEDYSLWDEIANVSAEVWWQHYMAA